jgi:hypothetical protein
MAVPDPGTNRRWNACRNARSSTLVSCFFPLAIKRYRLFVSCFSVAAICCIFAGCAEAELTQADLNDLDKLLAQRASASKAQKLEATRLIKLAEDATKQNRWDVASKIYIDSLIRYPSFRALVGRGESTARSDRRRDTLAETLSAQHAAFKSASVSLKAAVSFAERVPGEATQEQIAAARAQITCIESYDGGARGNCEPVASVLKRYANIKK